MAIPLPPNFALYNAQATKQPLIVAVIKGVPGILSSGVVGKSIQYGDPGLYYGDGSVYGGIRPLAFGDAGFRDYLDLNNSSLTVSQTVEPEQGRGSISQMTLSFIDKDQYMTGLIGGKVIPEILGQLVEVFLGFPQISWPNDYLRIFRGYITAVDSAAGSVTLSLSDPSVKMKAQTFFCSTTLTTADVPASGTFVPVVNNTGFFQYLLGPDGTYDPNVGLFVQVESEWMKYDPISGMPSATGFNVHRAQRGTAAADHASGSTVVAAIEVSGACTDLALQIMLSGWGKKWIENVPVRSVVNTFTVTDPGPEPSGFILPPNVDAVETYGLVPGDWYYGASFPASGNNVSGQIVRFQDLDGTPNNMIIVDRPLVLDSAATGTLGFRSQYDILPLDAGIGLTPQDVQVTDYQYFKKTFLGGIENVYDFFIDAPDSGKTFIESQLMLPLGAYALTRRGKLSMNLTMPPLADRGLTILSRDNILEPQLIKPMRAVNNRKFFNNVQYSYDPDDLGQYQQILQTLDTDSLNAIGIETILPIQANGVRQALGGAGFVSKRTQLLLARYTRGAVILPNVQVTWAVANSLEAGDVVSVQDTGLIGDLQISNFTTGQRGLGGMLFEVIGRTLDNKSMKGSLVLMAGIGAESTDRYGVIAPASHLTASGTSSQLYLQQDSFYSDTPTDEAAKWDQYIGMPIQVYTYADYSQSATGILTGIDPINRRFLTISPALPFTPGVNEVVTLAPFPQDSNPLDASFSKAVHCFLSPVVPIVSGLSQTQFTVASGDIGKFTPGFPIEVYNYGYTLASPELKVLSVDVTGFIVTTSAPMGFVPTAPACSAAFLGFDDGSPTYRWI